MPPPPSPHGTENRWRAGCRCSECRTAHNDGSRTFRRRVVDTRRFPPKLRDRLLALIAAGVHITDAAAALRTSQQAIHRYARVHPEWGAELDEALMGGRAPEVPHGTEAGYRHHRCRCPECRQAHHRPRTPAPASG